MNPVLVTPFKRARFRASDFSLLLLHERSRGENQRAHFRPFFTSYSACGFCRLTRKMYRIHSNISLQKAARPLATWGTIYCAPRYMSHDWIPLDSEKRQKNRPDALIHNKISLTHPLTPPQLNNCRSVCLIVSTHNKKTTTKNKHLSV